jgi:hypothetical protein
MHRRLTFNGEGGAVKALAKDLEPLAGVIGLSHHPGGSLKPPGDVLQVDVLNSAADEVLRRARRSVEKDGPRLVAVISQTSALVDRERQDEIDRDADEATWEEMESDLRNHGRITANYVLLMALGGVIAANAFLLDPVSQAMAFVGASIIAPAFEPVAKLTQALVLRSFHICAGALLSMVVGYAVLFGAALLTTLWLARDGSGHVHDLLVAQAVVKPLTDFLGTPLISAAAAIAGVVMIVSLRDFYVVGPLIVLVIISSVALAAAAVGLGEPRLALGALRRVSGDLALIVVLGGAVFYWKQRRFHHRRPLV